MSASTAISKFGNIVISIDLHNMIKIFATLPKNIPNLLLKLQHRKYN